MTEYIIGIDLGATRLRVACLDPDLHILERKEILTLSEQGPDVTIQRMIDLVHEVMPTEGGCLGIGISSAGPTNPYTGMIVAPPNLHGWHNVPIAPMLHDHFGITTYLGNDANVAVLAEATRGAARGSEHAIFITVSTGVGSGIITDGHLLQGRAGLGAEAGHIIMVAEEGRVTTLEKESSGTALARRAREHMVRGDHSIMWDMASGDADKLTGKIVGTAAQQGDALALTLVRHAGRMLGLGMVSLLHLFSPDVLVFGGGVSQLGDLLFDPMREAIREYSLDESYWDGLRVERARLGDNVSLVGAGALVITAGGIEQISKVVAKLTD